MAAFFCLGRDQRTRESCADLSPAECLSLVIIPGSALIKVRITDLWFEPLYGKLIFKSLLISLLHCLSMLFKMHI